MVALAQDILPRTAKHDKSISAGRRTARFTTAGSKRRGRANSRHFEPLESRTLLSSTLFVTAPGGLSDSTHFGTLQAALVVAVSGDTILLQPGFAMGTFASTTLVGAFNAGDTTVRVAAAMDVGQVVSIGTTNGTDPLERALVTSVTPTGTGDFFMTLATPLLFNHTGSPVSALNSSTTGPTIGIAKGITLSADPAMGAVTLPFCLEVWKGTTGATVSNLCLTTGSASSIMVDSDGNTFSGLTVSNQVVLNNAHTNTFSKMTVNNRLFVDTGSSSNLFTDSTFKAIQLRTGTNHNTFLRNTIGTLNAVGVNDNNGNDLFQDNTFTGRITITGNTNLSTNTAFVNNTFTLASGNLMVLEHVDGALLQGNTFNAAGAFATVITLHNSDNVVITGNTINTTGTQASGIFAYADVTGKLSVDIRGNAIHTTDGTAISLNKFDTTASLEARVQGNDLRNNAIGVSISGDGVSAGNVDVGGGSTRFGAGTGGNDFTTFATADGSHFAVGLFSTDSGFMTHADNNKWSVSDGLSVVADSLHTPDAFGTGLITAIVPPPPPPPPPPAAEVLTESVSDLATVETGSTSGVVAHFSSTFNHVAGDFAVTVTWEDGTTSAGTVVVNAGGGFDIVASHTWAFDGTFDFTVKVASNAGTTIEMDGVATITPRVLTAQGVSFTIDKKTPFSGVVAKFTDNLAGTSASAYVASVAWSDGTTTVGTVVKNADGTFSIKTSRGFTMSGVMVASVSVATLDGNFFATTSLTATITNPNDKVPGPKPKDLKKLAAFLRYHVEHGKPHQQQDQKCCIVKKGCLK